MDHLQELETRIHRWWLTTQQTRAGFDAYPEPALSGNVTALDARSFLRGLDADPPVFEIIDGYQMYSPTLPMKRDGTPSRLHFFGNEGTRASFRDETIAHWGALSELVLDHGWPMGHILSEPDGPAGLTRGSLDGLIRDPDGTVVLSMEAKATSRMLQHLIAAMNRCEGEVFKGHTRSDHKKCEGLMAFRPPLFWGVATGPTRELYSVGYGAEGPRLYPEPDASLLDLQG